MHVPLPRSQQPYCDRIWVNLKTHNDSLVPAHGWPCDHWRRCTARGGECQQSEDMIIISGIFEYCHLVWVQPNGIGCNQVEAIIALPEVGLSHELLHGHGQPAVHRDNRLRLNILLCKKTFSCSLDRGRLHIGVASVEGIANEVRTWHLGSWHGRWVGGRICVCILKKIYTW